MRTRRLKASGLIVLPMLVAAACGSTTSSVPSSPSTPTTAVTLTDLTGTWASRSSSWQWDLVQSGTSVTGISSFSSGAAGFGKGTFSGAGVVSGTFANSTFTFTDTAETVSLPNCTHDVSTGTLTLAGAALSGQVHETMTCDGVVLGPLSESIQFTKR